MNTWRSVQMVDNMSTDTRANHPARGVPILLTPDEVAGHLRTSKKAIYAMIERKQLPGIVRIGRRVLIREDAMLDWLGQKSHAVAGGT